MASSADVVDLDGNTLGRTNSRLSFVAITLIFSELVKRCGQNPRGPTRPKKPGLNRVKSGAIIPIMAPG